MEKNSTVIELRNTLTHALTSYNSKVSESAKGLTMSAVMVQLENCKSELNAALSAVNSMLATDYIESTPALTIMSSATPVPCLALVKQDNGTYQVEESTCKATMRMLKKYLPALSSEKAEAFARVAVYVSNFNDAPAVAAGALEVRVSESGKVTPREKAVQAIMADLPKSIGKLKPLFADYLTALVCRETSVKVTSAMWNDFAQLATVRGKNWGERGVIRATVAEDMVMEYIYMVLNGLSFRAITE